jgi:UDPglucose 6-dehydrogenase
MREAPAVVLINRLLEAGCEVCAFDPVALNSARGIFGERIRYCSVPYDAVKDADALCLVTEWQEFRLPDFEHMKKLMRHAAIFDGRNIWNGTRLQELGFDYYGIGTPSSALPDEGSR